jgi:hypothetical protein
MSSLRRSIFSPHTTSLAGLDEVVLQVGVAQVPGVEGPGRLVESLFQYSRSNGGGVSPLR